MRELLGSHVLTVVKNYVENYVHSYTLLVYIACKILGILFFKPKTR